MGHAFGMLAKFLWLTIMVPLIFFAIWLITRIWPKKHATTSWILISSFDFIFIIYLSFALCGLSGFLGKPGFGGAIWNVLIAMIWDAPNSDAEFWFCLWKIALLLVVIACVIFYSNKKIYSLPRRSRLFIHFQFSVIMVLVFLGLNEPSIGGPLIRWYVNPKQLFLDAGDPQFPKYSGTDRWSDYYRFDSEQKDYYHFEEKLLGDNRYYRQEFDFYEHYTKRTIIDTNIINASDASKYLLLHDIGNYQLVTQEQKNPLISKAVYTTRGYYVNFNPGLLQNAHFAIDHIDTSYSTIYRDRPDKVAVKVEVTQHAGSESDKWLQHELESVLKGRTEGIHIVDRRKAQIDTEINNNIILRAFEFGFGWSHTIFGWTHDNTVITVNWSRPNEAIQRPYAIIAEYLDKYPSSINRTSVDIYHRSWNVWNRDDEYINKEFWSNWNRTEMQRQLWLSNKWLAQLQDGDVDYDMKLKNILRHAFMFLNYKEAICNSNVLEEKKNAWKLFKAKDIAQLRTLLKKYDKWVESVEKS